MATRGTQGTEDEIFEFAAAPHIIKRPRLTRILDEGDSRVTVLWAPAGYGKTTLAREWVATRDEQVFWHSGGPSMADVAAFAVDLAELFAGKESDLAERVRFPAARGEPPRVLAKAVSTGAPDAAALVVVDDYHYAGEGTDADEFFRELFELTSFRLLLGSRVRPAWIDARKTVYGEALVVEQEALAFTPDEGAAVLPDGGSVLEQAHGWPAVIGLAAARGVSVGELEALPPDELYDFVAQDMFGAVPAELQRSLLLLGAGGDASRDVARELLGSRFAAHVSAILDRGFAVRTDRGWIEIHPLLRLFLWRQLGFSDPKSRRSVIARVLATLRAHTRWDQALYLLERFPAEDPAAEILGLALDELLASGRATTVVRWIELARANLFTAAVFALAEAELDLRQGRDESAIARASEAANRLEDDLAARAHLVTARAAHQLDDTLTTATHAEKAGALASSAELRTEAFWLAMMNVYERKPGDLEREVARFRSLDDPRPEWRFRLACADAFILLAGNLYGADADIRASLRAAERAIALLPEVRDPYLRTNALNVQAHVLRILAEYDAAIRASEALMREAEEYRLDFALDHALLAKLGALIGLRRLAGARETLRELESRGRGNLHVVRNLAVQRAKLQITVGDLVGAQRTLSERAPVASGTITDAGEYLALRALVAGARGDRPTAIQALTEASETRQYEEVVPFSSLARTLIALREQEDPALAVDAVNEQMERGTMDALVVGCRAYPRLATLAVAGGAGESLQWLFNRSNDFDLGRRAGLSMPRELRRREALSPREREVYELLRQGRTNGEIARTLFISISTAKVHVRHIFEKLGVHNRAEAAAADLTED